MIKRPKQAARRMKGPQRISVPVDEAAFLYLSQRANESGTSLSRYCSTMLLAGVLSENLMQAEQRLAEIVQWTKGNASQGSSLAPDIVQSIFLTERLLTRIAESQNPQILYEAQTWAKQKAERVLAMADEPAGGTN